MYVRGHIVAQTKREGSAIRTLTISICPSYVLYWLLLSQYRERNSIRSQFPFIFESIPQTIEYLKMLRYSSSVTMNGTLYRRVAGFTIYISIGCVIAFVLQPQYRNQLQSILYIFEVCRTTKINLKYCCLRFHCFDFESTLCAFLLIIMITSVLSSLGLVLFGLVMVSNVYLLSRIVLIILPACNTTTSHCSIRGDLVVTSVNSPTRGDFFVHNLTRMIVAIFGKNIDFNMIVFSFQNFFSFLWTFLFIKSFFSKIYKV